TRSSALAHVSQSSAGVSLHGCEHSPTHAPAPAHAIALIARASGGVLGGDTIRSGRSTGRSIPITYTRTPSSRRSAAKRWCSRAPPSSGAANDGRWPVTSTTDSGVHTPSVGVVLAKWRYDATVVCDRGRLSRAPGSGIAVELP